MLKKWNWTVNNIAGENQCKVLWGKDFLHDKIWVLWQLKAICLMENDHIDLKRLLMGPISWMKSYSEMNLNALKQ